MILPSPPRVQLAQIPTPLQRLSRVSRQLGAEIWMKRDDLTGSILSGNKVRKLEYSIGQARSEGCDTLITCGGLQSNHCRATAAAGAQLGMAVELLLRGSVSGEADGNLLLDGLLGAEVSLISNPNDHKRLPELMEARAKELRRLGKTPFVIPVGASDEIGLWGYLDAAKELGDNFQDAEISPDFIICASGSGGTQAGLTVGAKVHNLNASVVGMAVCDDEAYFQEKVRHDIDRWKARYQIGGLPCDFDVRVNDRYIGPGYAQADRAVFECIEWLAKTEGVVLDPVYTGKAFLGMVEELKMGNFGHEPTIVFIHTGGLFGLYPYRDKFHLKVNNN